MNEIAIHVQNLSKLYRIARHRERYPTFRDACVNAVASPFRKARDLFRGIHTGAAGLTDTIWALKGVSFEVKKGEVMGIIGRNGAGKSTLLRILSRITEPTEGYADIHGRVGSLLEVGTGFHPELTGRENTYLNGAILGMRKAEIDRKFDEIVDFAEVEKFVDTPVKHYSSGMQVRLAFAVAAHLQPEVLLVDEVLAVGDIAFKKKCLGKMGDVAKGGRTVLFVSHQMNQVRRLCSQCVWLDDGRLAKWGSTPEVVSGYEAAMDSVSFEKESRRQDAKYAARFMKWEIMDPQHQQPNFLTTNGPLKLRFITRVNKPIKKANHGIALYDKGSQLMWSSRVSDLSFKPGIYEFVYELSSLPLRPGNYFWRVALFNREGVLDDWFCVPELVVATKPMSHPMDDWMGILNMPYEFSLERYRG